MWYRGSVGDHLYRRLQEQLYFELEHRLNGQIRDQLGTPNGRLSEEFIGGPSGSMFGHLSSCLDIRLYGGLDAVSK